jgi:VWFA-related protein
MSLRRVAVLVGFLASSLGAPRLVAQVVREKVAVEVLTVRLAARDRSGKPVEDLAMTDLALSVDGRPVAIETFGRSAALPESSGPASGDLGLPLIASTSLAPLARTLIFADEGETLSFDRREVYDQLDRFLRAEVSGRRREVLIARFAGGRLEVACPWTENTDRAVSVLQALRRSPAANLMPTASELSGSGTPVIWIQSYRERLHQALLEAQASFPEGPAERQLLLISGGTVLMRPTDLIAVLRCEITGAERTRLRLLQTDESAAHAREIERATFALWSRAVNPAGDVLTMSDVVAKALERDIAVIPVAAEAIDRGSDLGMDQKSPSLFAAGDSRMSPRLGVAQAMTEIAADTGSEPILVPGKTGARLAEIQARSVYTVTFRDPAGDHRYHRIELTCRRKGVTIDYRRGYRIPADEERALDTVVARLLQSDRGADPLNATASLSPAESGGRTVTRVAVRIEPPRETAAPSERLVEFVGIGESASCQRTEPVRWSGTARVVDGEPHAYAAVADLCVPYGGYRWSLAVRDAETGLTSFLLVSRP